MSTVFINEFHYKNAGADTNEFVEIAGPAGSDLTNYSIVIYRNNGNIFRQESLSGTIPNQADGFGTVSVDFSNGNNGNNGIREAGAIALVNNGNVAQFLSYGGTVTATEGAAIGTTSTDIGIQETDSTPEDGSLQLQGNGDDFSDFTWVAVNNASSGAINNSQTFITPDTTAPSLTGTISPADNGTDVAVNAFISFDLGEDVTAVAGENITITDEDGNVTTIAANDPQVTINGGVVTINPTADFLNGKEYSVEIEEGAFIDATGNEFDGTLAADGAFNFTTITAPDTTAPSLTGTISPADNGTDVAVNAFISFDLGEDVTAVAGENITITDEDGNVTTIAANDPQVTINGGVVTINPTADFLNGKEYTVEIEEGAFIDATGNEFDGTLAADGAFNFTTITAPDTTAPSLTGTISPADNGTDVAVNAFISFDLGEDVTAVAGENITITDEDGNVTTIAANDPQVTINGGVVTINPTADFLNGKEYTVEIEEGAFIDATGNQFDGTLAADGAFNFTTVAAPVTPPTTPSPITPVEAGNPIGTVTEGDNVMEVIDLRGFANQTVTATYEISREADYDNNIYFYTVDSADGSIDGVASDEDGYLAKALGNVVNTGITANDGAEDVAGSFTLQGGDILGIAIVADGTASQATSNLSSVEGVYLSYMGANTDNGSFDHIRFENNMFRFEDLANGGDADFNDMEIKIDFA